MTERGLAMLSLSDAIGMGGDDLRKRGTQNGSYRLKNGAWFVRFNEPRRDRNGNIVWKRTEKRVRDAERKEILAWDRNGAVPRDVERTGYDDFVSPANKLTANPVTMATVAEFVTMRFKPDHYPTLKKAGREHYNSQLTHILPTIGGMKLCDVSPVAVQMLLTSKAMDLAPWTVRHIRDAISAIFRHAKKLQFYSGDLPTEGVTIPKITEVPRRTLNLDQVALIANTVKPRYRALIWALAYTGMRIGEACGLKWKYVNLTEVPVQADGVWVMPMSLFVRWQYSRNEWSEPKKNSQRPIPLHPKLVEILRQHRAWSKWTDPEDCVFHSRNTRAKNASGPMDAHNIATCALKPATKKLGIPWATFHTFRHTASTVYDEVLSERQRQELLGHRQASMTRRYTHPELEQIRSAMSRVQ